MNWKNVIFVIEYASKKNCRKKIAQLKEHHFHT